MIPTRNPFTATLGIPISPKSRPWSEGTGGFYLSAGGDDKSIYFVTSRHIFFPEDDNSMYMHQNDSMAPEEVMILGSSAFNEKLDNINYEIRGQQFAITDALERIKSVMNMNDSASVIERRDAEWDLQKAKEGLKSLIALHHDIATHWKSKDNRVFGELIWAPPISLSTTPDHYTLDIAVIKIDVDKLDSRNYLGNTISIGNKYTPQEFMDRVYMHYTNTSKSSFPANRLVKLQDQVPKIALTKQPICDKANEPCLIVFKNGAATGTTIGKANNVSSYTRQYFTDKYMESREWPIIPTNKDSGAFSDKGDSGSCIADAFSCVGGIITGGSGATESADVTYVTPISYIMEVLHSFKPFQYAHLNPILTH
jgi:Peptidase family S64